MKSSAKAIKQFVKDDLFDGVPLIGDPFADGRLDSLAIEQLVAFLEETYGLEVQDEDLAAENFGSLKAVARYVDAQRHLRERAQKSQEP